METIIYFSGAIVVFLINIGVFFHLADLLDEESYTQIDYFLMAWIVLASLYIGLVWPVVIPVVVVLFILTKTFPHIIGHVVKFYKSIRDKWVS